MAGVKRVLSETDDLYFSIALKQGNGEIAAVANHHSDRSVHLLVSEQDRLIYELKTHYDSQGSMFVTERNHVTGDSIDYDVPAEECDRDDYDPQWLGSVSIGSFNGCLVGSYWQSWLGPRSDFRPYLLEKIAEKRNAVEYDPGENLFILRTDPSRRGQHIFYFDATSFLLGRWETVFDSDPTLNRDRVYVYYKTSDMAKAKETLDLTEMP